MQTTENSKTQGSHPAARGLEIFRPEDEGGRNFREVLESLWEGRFIILISVICFSLFGGIYAWQATPIFQAQAILQIKENRAFSGDQRATKLEGALLESNDIPAEIEILHSKEVLGRVVKVKKLDILAQPDYAPLIGKALARRNPNAPRIAVQSFDLPSELAGKPFRIVALGEDQFRWEGPDHQILGQGKIGDTLRADLGSGVATLQVQSLNGKPGQRFLLSKREISLAVEDLGKTIEISQKGGKESNLLSLTLDHPSPVKSSEILNEIINQYLEFKAEKKASQAGKVLATLREQLPLLQPTLHSDESKLTSFKEARGIVDPAREADALLQLSTTLYGQISALKQRREELLRTYTESADVVTTLNQQIRKLENEVAILEARRRSIGGKEEVVGRLARDVQAGTEFYSALINVIQQYQVAAIGGATNVLVVDSAATSPVPRKPNKQLIMVAFWVVGVLVGVGISAIRRLLRQCVRDYRIIESDLGIPVLETIPHSNAQKDISRHARKDKKVHLLSLDNADDPAVEGLRGLRTLLHINMRDSESRVIIVTSPSPSAGKTFICGNLAATMAQGGAKVLLVDADLRKGAQHLAFGMAERGLGLSNILSKARGWQTVIKPIPYTSEDGATIISGLSLITTGPLPLNPSELLLTNRFSDFLAEASEMFDYVIVDTPPLLAVSDATLIASSAGSVLLVARYGQHPLSELKACKMRLEKNGIPLDGCIFNDVDVDGLMHFFHPHQYAYRYSYKS